MFAPLVAVLVFTQAGATPAGAAPGEAAPADAATRAAVAAERAAQAAASAAESAAKAADAAVRISGAAAKPEGPAAPAPAEAKPSSVWTGTVGLGLISLTGNSKTVTFNANAAAERKSQGWIFGTKLYGRYGQNRVAVGGATETVAEAAGIQLRADRRFHERYSAYVLGAGDTDHVKSVEARSTGEVGASIMWIDAGSDAGWKVNLKTDLGFRIANERRHQYFPTTGHVPDETLYAPRAALALRYAMSKDVVFTEDAEILPNVVGPGRVVVNSLSKISSRFSRTLAFGVSLAVNHDSVPAPGKVATDTALALTLDVLF